MLERARCVTLGPSHQSGATKGRKEESFDVPVDSAVARQVQLSRSTTICTIAVPVAASETTQLAKL